MKKRLIALLTILFLLFPTIAFAFDSNKYYSDIKIGLENLLAPSITVTMLGNYTSNGQAFPAGTSFVLNFDNYKINMNGTLYDQLTFTPSTSDDLIKLKYGAKEYSYKGMMTFKISGNMIIPINTVNIEEYLKGVVAYEMSNSYPIEALKAQAIASRSYAIFNLGKHQSDGYNLCDTTDCQVYRGYNPAYTNVIRAVEETRGIVLLYNNEIAGCYYAASNGGYTEASKNVWVSDVPYLQSRKDDYDSALWPAGDRKLTTSDIQNTLKSKGYIQSTDTFVKIDLNSITYYDSGRVSNINIIYNDAVGIQHTKSFTKDSARYFLSFPSSMYTVTYDQPTDTYTFSGKGNGHGIGLSQIGTKNRANAGQTYDEILGFYYPGCIIKAVDAKIDDISKSGDPIKLGDSITLNAVMDGSTSGSLYKYIIDKDGKTVYTGNYDYNTQLVYKPTESGSYTVKLYVKDASSSNEYDEQSATSFSVYSMPVITGVSINPQQAILNKPVAAAVSVSGGSSSGYDIIYEIVKDGNVISSSTGGNTFTFTPDKEGQYAINVKVKDRTSTNAFDSLKTVNINVIKQQEPSRGSTQLFTISRTLKAGVSGSDVSALQNALTKLGYYTYGKTTTYFGTVTKNAVISFQKKNGLKATGIVDASTASAINNALIRKTQQTPSSSCSSSQSSNTVLYSISRTLKAGVSGSDVSALQNALTKLGYYTYGKVTTYFGTVTKNAVISFQKKNGLKATGVVDSSTASLINKSLASKTQSAAASSSTKQPSSTQKTTASRGTVIAFKLTRNLKNGMSGSDVKQLQDILKQLGYFKEKSTGYYGSVTVAAVKQFQKVNKISQTGIVSTATAAAINKVI